MEECRCRPKRVGILSTEQKLSPSKSILHALCEKWGVPRGSAEPPLDVCDLLRADDGVTEMLFRSRSPVGGDAVLRRTTRAPISSNAVSGLLRGQPGWTTLEAIHNIGDLFRQE